MAVAGKVSPFVSDLSAVNMLLSFCVSMFSYTVFLFLEAYSVPIYYAGLGLSLGQALSIISAVYVGRMNDKGHSFSMMFYGALVYSLSIVAIYSVANQHFLLLVTVPIVIIALIVFEGFFRSSLNVFVSKSVSREMLGASYSRINALELIGSAFSFIVLLTAALSNNLGIVYLASGTILFLVSIWVFSMLHRKERNRLIVEMNSVPRPRFFESLRVMKAKGNAVASIVVTKALMTVGTLTFTYFYLLSGEYVGVGLEYLFATLATAFVLGAVFSRIGERLMARGMDLGRKSYVYMALNDVLTYSILLAAVFLGSKLLIILSVFSSSTNPIFSAGILSYDVKAIGKENRGMFGGVQRLTIGTFSAVAILPLTFLYLADSIMVWAVVVIVSITSVITSLLVPKLAA